MLFLASLLLAATAGLALFSWRTSDLEVAQPAKAQTHHTYYMCHEGCDFKTLKEAFQGPNAMQGGDTLIIRDGTYEGSDNSINQYNKPPVGSEGNYTTIKAEHDGKVIIIGVGGASSYCQLEGIKWIGQAGTGADHNKFLRCIIEGNVPDGNIMAFTVGGHHNLAEDCIVYGKGRYKVYIGGQYNILRRVIARRDYANKNEEVSGMPISTFAAYSAHDAEFQNCISIDGDQPMFWDYTCTECPGASFYAPNGAGRIKYRGCIGLNSACRGASDGADDVMTFDDCVFWHRLAGIETHSAGGTFRHCAVGGFARTEDFVWPEGSPAVGGGWGIAGGSIAENNIVTGAYYFAIGTGSSITNCLWDNVVDHNSWVNTIIDPITDVDPIYHPQTNPTGALKYLVRIEEGSPLKGRATDGGDIGATILKRIGRSGTLWGEPGWNEVTNEDLWPWPNEDMIKEHMGNYNRGGVDPNLPDGNRGFAAYVSPFGSPSTLTSYIWEYLGNQIPDEIYGANPSLTCLQAGGVCKEQPCSNYSSCSTMNRSCPSGYCCQGTCIENFPPTVQITASPTSGQAPLAVNFQGTAADPDGTISSWLWHFGDGASSNQQSPSHTYTAQGNYTATLTVTDNQGLSRSASLSITVSAPSQSQTITFQQGLNSYQGCQTNNLIQSMPQTNNGGADYVTLEDSDTDFKYGLVKFDNIISTTAGIPPNSTILSAKLELYQMFIPNDGYDRPGALKLHRMLTNPVYGNSWGSVNDEANESTWSHFAYNETKWGNNTQETPQAGIDYDSIPDADVSWPVLLAQGWLQIDITSLVQEWVNGANNYGMLLIPEQTPQSTTYTRIRSASWDTQSQRPKLTITYTTEARPNITLTKQVNKTQASQGEELTYTITYTNSGTAEARNIIISDAIPSGTIYISGGNRVENNVVYWDIASLASGAAGSVQLKVKVE